jgi:hypothetical protein
MSNQLCEDGYPIGRFRARSLMRKAGVSVKHRNKFKITTDDAKSDVIKYIEMFYNSHRLHSFLEYKTPNAFESDFTLPKVA